jgi:hypothetical protein
MKHMFQLCRNWHLAFSLAGLLLEGIKTSRGLLRAFAAVSICHNCL